MAPLAAVLRGLAHRGSSTVMIFMVALVAVAAATVGPAYYGASKASILADTVTAAPVAGRGFEATQSGSVSRSLRSLESQVQAELTGDLGGGLAGRAFASPVLALEMGVVDPGLQAGIPVVWRSGMCAHLRIRGRCPGSRGDVMVSSSAAQTNVWHIGQQLRVTQAGLVTITGIYQPPDATADYWFGRGPIYFPYEESSGNARAVGASAYDAMFTPASTFAGLPDAAQGTAVVDDLLTVRDLRVADVPVLIAGMGAAAGSESLANTQVVLVSAIPATLGTVQSSWSALAVPVVLITAQLLAVTWLLLFLTVTDAVEARGPEIALAKLRGQGRLRIVTFGLSEPVVLLLAALPLGVLAGWGATGVLARVLLGGVPVRLPVLGWAAAGAATAGGLAAVVLAARRTLRRPVAEQWRRAGRRGADRGWVVDAILVTGAAAGLLDLAASGQVGSARRGVLVLLVPGLLGLAVAVVASRLLPLACRAGFGRTRGRGGVGGYLALRHIARRPGGVRTTIVLATSFALAAFAVTAWSVGHDNDRLVASAQVGAPEALTVAVPAGRDLGAIVDRADPGGRRAMAVDQYVSLQGNSSGVGLVILGVESSRFAGIAAWRPGYAATPLPSLARQLAPPEPPSVILTGDAMRVTVTVASLSAQAALVADVDNEGAVTPVDLGRLPARGAATLTGPLSGNCPCLLQDLRVATLPADAGKPLGGVVIFNGLQDRSGTGWASAPTGFTGAARWSGSITHTPPDTVTAVSGGLRWQFSYSPRQDAQLTVADRPDPLPAIVSAAVSGSSPGSVVQGVGLDGRPLGMRVIAAAAAVPSAPASGILVDRRYAELADGGNLSQVTEQVWLAAGADRVIRPRLAAAGVRVLSAESSAAVAAMLGRQGPGLGSVLFLADAAAAALLAAGAAILGLYLSARRRRYEYAALAATGVRARELRTALLIEQVVVLGFGTVAGLGTGLAAAALVLRNVPEFISQPAAPPLSYVPAAGPLAALLGIAAGVLVIAAATASGALIHGVDLDQLREAPA